MEIGLLLLRLVIGLTLAAHGAQKLFGWFGGHGIAGTAGFLAQLGFRPAKLHAALAGLTEFGGGLLLAAGLATPAAAAIIVAVMLVAGVSVHSGKGFFGTSGGFEYTFVLAGAALALAFTGAGPYSADAALHLDIAGWQWGVGALAAGLTGGAGALASRAPAGIAQPAK